MAEKRALKMKPNDNTATVLEEVLPGEDVIARMGNEVFTVKAIEKVPFAFKIALTDIPKGGMIYKYGEVIGRASTDIKQGSMVHVHNLEGTRGRGDLAPKGA
ncbi:MAG: UxaA family hydrolase [Bacteroidetes bacterium]|nr:UxaA family hydrolase [Bacteroidota bacterium]MCL5025408.1 UxaA family hydrolase [Chloroflexota bacterium]